MLFVQSYLSTETKEVKFIYGFVLEFVVLKTMCFVCLSFDFDNDKTSEIISLS